MRLKTIQLGLLVLLASCGGGGGGDAPVVTIPPPDPLPGVTPAIELSRAFPNISFSQPVALLQRPDTSASWFVVEQAGVVRQFSNDNATSASSVYLDIRDRVDSSAGEAGLLGMAFHPQFPASPYVYVSYTATGPGGGTPFISTISRFTTNDGGATLNVASENILMQVLQDATNHNGGHLAFGNDGFLYIGFGDGGGGGDPNDNAQNTSNLLGTVVRIDIDGGSPFAIPSDNPFAANAECIQGFGAAPCPEIFAYGLRNPWRFSFDSATGDLWLGDVGQGAWEEINLVTVGGDYGWDDREGAHCFEPMTGCIEDSIDPVTEYDHSVGQSVTGGYVYRGTAIPALAGWYVFADFVSGEVFGITASSAPGVDPTILVQSDLNVVTFAQDADNELLLVDYSTGSIYRVENAL